MAGQLTLMIRWWKSMNGAGRVQVGRLSRGCHGTGRHHGRFSGGRLVQWCLLSREAFPIIARRFDWFFLLRDRNLGSPIDHCFARWPVFRGGSLGKSVIGQCIGEFARKVFLLCLRSRRLKVEFSSFLVQDIELVKGREPVRELVGWTL